jgi:hypothetical protein
LAGSISIVSSAASSPTIIALTGTGIAPGLTLSSKSVAFGTQLVTTGTTSTITVTSSGGAPLTISSITATGAGYSQTNTCLAGNVGVGLVCTITVGFVPATTGPLTGSISIVSNASSSPDTIALTGTGGDFSLSATTPTMTVTSGKTATIQFSATSVSGYTGTVTLACLGATTGEACTITPSSVTLSGTAQSFTATVSTTSVYLAGVTLGGSPRQPGKKFYEGAGGVSMALLLGFVGRRRLRDYRRAISVGLAMMLVVVIAGCATNYNQLNPAGTLLGTQTLTVIATSNGVSRSTTVTLTVQ